MSDREKYAPGPAAGAEVRKDGEAWTLILVRELRHPPEMVWRALTDPAQLSEWAPFDADRNLGAVGPVKLSTVGAPQISETNVKRAEAPRLLEFDWNGNLRWELEPLGGGTRLTLWAGINRGYIAWGAAGWHICFDVLDQFLAGEPIGRMAGPAVMKLAGWQRLTTEYAGQFGVEAPELVTERRNDMKKTAAPKGESASRLIDARIRELDDWRGEMLSRLRALIRQADPAVVEEWKWEVPVWSHDGLICTGETYKSVVKLTFAKGARLKDPKNLFNSSLEGSTRRAIDFHQGGKVDRPALKALIREAVSLNTSLK